MSQNIDRRSAIKRIAKLFAGAGVAIVGGGCATSPRSPFSPAEYGRAVQYQQYAQEDRLQRYQQQDFEELAPYVYFMPAIKHVGEPRFLQGRGLGWSFQFSGNNYNAPEDGSFTDGEYLIYQRRNDDRIFHEISLTMPDAGRRQRVRLVIANLGGAESVESISGLGNNPSSDQIKALLSIRDVIQKEFPFDRGYLPQEASPYQPRALVDIPLFKMYHDPR